MTSPIEPLDEIVLHVRFPDVVNLQPEHFLFLENPEVKTALAQLTKYIKSQRPQFTPEQLKQMYRDSLEHDSAGASWFTNWQTFANKVNGVPEIDENGQPLSELQEKEQS